MSENRRLQEVANDVLGVEPCHQKRQRDDTPKLVLGRDSKQVITMSVRAVRAIQAHKPLSVFLPSKESAPQSRGGGG